MRVERTSPGADAGPSVARHLRSLLSPGSSNSSAEEIALACHLRLRQYERWFPPALPFVSVAVSFRPTRSPRGDDLIRVGTSCQSTAVRRALGLFERRPVLSIFCIALVLRLAFVVLAAVFAPWPVIPDERQYVDLAKLVAEGQLTSKTWDGYAITLFRTTDAYTGPLSLLFWMFGPRRILGSLLAVGFGAATAALTVRLSMEMLSRRWAFAAGAIVAVLPSQVLWSSVTLRESMVWASLAGLGLIVAIAGREAHGGRLLLFALACGACLVALGNLRAQTFVVAAWCLAIAPWLFRPERRLVARFGALALGVGVPVLVGYGIGGIRLVVPSAERVGATRAVMAVDAESAFVEPGVTVGGGADSPGAIHAVRGGVTTDRTIDVGLKAQVIHIPSGLVAVTLRPFPWESPDNVGLLLAQIETLFWIALYAVGAVGLVRRPARRVMAFPFLVLGGVTVVAALTQGNLGTAFRHRGQVLWVLALFAAAGASALRAKRAARSAPEATAELELAANQIA